MAHCDWLSLKLDRRVCYDWPGWALLQDYGDRILRVCPKTGEVRWETWAWDNIRSDSHQVSFRCDGGFIYLHGSPARVMGSGDTVFGDPGAGSDLAACAWAMIGFMAAQLGLSEVPGLSYWTCTRADVTCNYDLGSLGNVRVAVQELRNVTEGRYRVSHQDGDSLYFNRRSEYKTLLIYQKGPHLRHLMKQESYTGLRYSDSDLVLADRLLRFELKLKSKFFAGLRKEGQKWYELPWSFFEDAHTDYLSHLIGDLSSDDMTTILDALRKLPDPTGRHQFITEAYVNAVYRTYALISKEGLERARSTLPQNTYYRHIRCLKAIGLSPGDLAVGRIISFRRPMLLKPVNSWAELRKAA